MWTEIKNYIRKKWLKLISIALCIGIWVCYFKVDDIPSLQDIDWFYMSCIKVILVACSYAVLLIPDLFRRFSHK